MTTLRVCVVVGTRPEIIKMSSVIKWLLSEEVDFSLVHTGQHYDAELSKVLFADLGLPSPDLNLSVGSGSHATQTARALLGLEATFRKLSPDLVLVEGDTNSVLAASLAAIKMHIKVGHIEAGLRSYDTRMPEEYNRIVADHVSSYLFAPTRNAATTLRGESCSGEIHVTGNTVIDSCLNYGPEATKRGEGRKKIPYDNFALATVHRSENVDDPIVLKRISSIIAKCPFPVVYPIHPRTMMRLRDAGIESKLKASKNVFLSPPLGYFDFLDLLMSCAFILTDSGGIQEEATAPNIRKKTFVLRNSTERPEAVKAGFAEVVGTDPKFVLSKLGRFVRKKWTPPKKSPFGDGKAGSRIAKIVKSLC